MKRIVQVVSALIAGLLLSQTAVAIAHERLLSPPPRANMEPNQKIFPCGNLPRSPNPMTLKPGSTFNVTWTQTIHHPGWFRVSFRTDDTGDFNKTILVDMVKSVDNVDNGNIMVTLPNTPCTQCTLHVSQIMTDQPDKTVASGYKEYNACADLILSDNPNTPPPAGTTTGATPMTPPTDGEGTGGTTGTAATNPTDVPTDDAGKMPTGGCSAVDPSPFLLLGALAVMSVWRRRAA